MMKARAAAMAAEVVEDLARRVKQPRLTPEEVKGRQADLRQALEAYLEAHSHLLDLVMGAMER